MTRAELIKELQNKMPHLSAQAVEDAVKTVMRDMNNSLSRGERIEIRGFGAFALKYQKPRVARNPQTGEAVDSPGKYRVHFKAGKALRERVNNASKATSASNHQMENDNPD